MCFCRSSVDKQIRHRACSLRDYAYTLIKTEMDTDFEDKCQEISRKRRIRKHCPTQYLPPYINTPGIYHLLSFLFLIFFIDRISAGINRNIGSIADNYKDEKSC